MHDYGHTVLRNTKCLWKKWDKRLADMMEKEKLFNRRNFSFSHSIFQRGNRSSYTSRNRYTSTASIFRCFIVCCVTRLFFQLVLYRSRHPDIGRPV